LADAFKIFLRRVMDEAYDFTVSING